MAGYSLWRINMLRELVLERLQLSSKPLPEHRLGSIVMINRESARIRKESQPVFKARLAAMEMAYPGRVQVFSDKNTALIGCIECVARMFNNASVIIGQHGAGLTNILFARQGTIVIEQSSRGGNPCYMDLSYTLGLQYHLARGLDYPGGEAETGWARHFIDAITLLKPGGTD
jgi:hypothetical protein